jgi:hypothetical protein
MRIIGTNMVNIIIFKNYLNFSNNSIPFLKNGANPIVDHNSFWNISISDVISLLLGFIAFFVALPSL